MVEYTPKFKKAYSKVLEVLETQGVEKAKVAFHDEMLSLGHSERVENLYRVKDKLSGKAVQLPLQFRSVYHSPTTLKSLIMPDTPASSRYG